MRTRPLLVLALLVAGLVGPSVPAAAAPTTVKVMTLNDFYGGDEWNPVTRRWCAGPAGCPETLRLVAHEIRRAGADVVGLQEGTATECVLADLLGWYCLPRLQLISRYPLIDPPGANGRYAFVQLAPGRVVAMSNVHLPSTPYGPYRVRNGASRREVLRLERTTRLPAIRPQLVTLPRLAAAGIPVFLTGDFNSPSHYDWTRAVDAVREEVRYPVRWPVSRALAGAGLRDSYREIHPDPVARPGFTWTPPGTLESVPNEVHDRIDWVLFAGPATPVASYLVGEAGGPDVDVELDPYPTDHRGVVSTFRVTPGDPGPFVAVHERRVFIGDRLGITYHGDADRIALVRAGGSPSSAIASAPARGRDGVLEFRTHALTTGQHDAVLIDDGAVVSRSPFWAYAKGTDPSVRVSRRVYAVGEPIRVSWRAAPGYRADWLGVFVPGRGPGPRAEVCDAGTCGNGYYLIYDYTRTNVQGSIRIGPRSLAGYRRWPLRAGVYEIRMLMDDGYRLLAISGTFRVGSG